MPSISFERGCEACGLGEPLAIMPATLAGDVHAMLCPPCMRKISRAIRTSPASAEIRQIDAKVAVLGTVTPQSASYAQHLQEAAGYAKRRNDLAVGLADAAEAMLVAANEKAAPPKGGKS